MDDRTVRLALERHWHASDASDFKAEHEIYREDAVLDYPQSGERIRGRHNIQESRTVQPSKKRFTVRRIIGSGDLLTPDPRVRILSSEWAKARRSKYTAEKIPDRR
jgi:ketosteroid isomerase-like protein